MAGVRFDIDLAGADAYAAELAAPWLLGIGREMEHNARNMVNKRTGRTASMIRVVPPHRAGRMMRVVLRCDSPIAGIENSGSQPHSIDQHHGGPMLTFYWAKVGHWVRFAHVNHPGTRGSRFLTGALVVAGQDHGLRVNLVR